MEVLFITHKYPPSIGGMEKQSYHLIKGMSKKCKTHTIIYDSKKESRVMFFFLLKRRIKKILTQNPNIDLIHLNDGLMAAFTTWLTGYTNIPVVATFHGLDVVFPLDYFQKNVIPEFQRLAGCIAVSDATKDELITRGIRPARVFKIRNGVDHNLIQCRIQPSYIKKLESIIGAKPADKRVLITMGRPVKRKGFTWFIEKVVPNLPEDVILLIIGPFQHQKKILDYFWSLVPKGLKSKLELFLGLSSDQDKLRNLLQNRNVVRRVFHLGKIPFEEVLQTLSLADIFIMPNVRVDGDAEGFGLVALESTIRGTPVLASNLEGITDAIHHGKNGWLIKHEDSEEWICTLYRLLSDQQKLREFGRKAQSYTMAQFDWEMMAAEYYRVFKEIIEKSNNNKNGFQQEHRLHGVRSLPSQHPSFVS